MDKANVEAENLTSSTSAQTSRRFTIAEIQSATENFDDELVIGQGGFGKVYKGQISIEESCHFVAIKRLDSASNQGSAEFKAEIEMLSKLRHCNLVSLIGYCDENREMILVYVYMPRGTLYDHLHKVTATPLSWIQRLKIAIGAGRGLDYLHTGFGTKHEIVHRDVKSSNILLDENWAAMISDFGLSKIGPIDQTAFNVSVSVKGTWGYLDPEYFYTRKLTRKTDVYAFGVLLFELLSGMLAVDERLQDEHCSLASWAQKCVKERKFDKTVDSSITGTIAPKCLKGYAEIANRCLLRDFVKRPSMTQVVAKLQDLLDLQEKFDNSADSTGTSGFTWMINKYRASATNKNSAISQTTNTSNTTNSLSSGASSKISTGSQFSAASGSDSIGSGGLILSHPNLRLFSFAELKIATRNFRSDTVLSEGGFGKVYKGWLKDRSTSRYTVIAVKKLNSESIQGLEEWQAEVDFLGRLSHPNLVKLLGNCYEGTELLLVYEFMQKGSLENHLFGRGSMVQPLPWDIRLKISIGAARGLAFLHASEKQIIYRDFKASNILLDGLYNAKLSDFGLAIFGPSASQSHVTTRVMGTYGYVAPEYVSTGHLYVKSDVYGFGVFLVEMLTGLRAFDTTRPSDKHNLTAWIKPFLTGGRKLEKVMDARLEGRYPSKATSQIDQLAITCIGPEPKSRPSMKEIVEKLEQLDAINERPKVPRVHHSSHPSPY